MKKFLLLSTFCLLAVNAFASAGDGVYISSPVYPGTGLHFAYVAWNCAKPGTCMKPTDFTPVRSDYNWAENFVNENGVCRALGYEKAVANSSSFGGDSDDWRRIQVDSDGVVAGAVAGCDLGGITCLNKLAAPKFERVVMIQNPMHPTLKIPFAAAAPGPEYVCPNAPELASSENAVCRVLGYDHAVTQSSYQQDCEDRVKTAKVAENGTVTPVDALAMNYIACVL